MDIELIFPDNSKKKFKKGISGIKVAESIGAGLARAALAVKVNDELLDLNRPIEKNARIEIITFKNDEGKKIFWHSSTHLMAWAVKELFPKAKFGIGPPIEEGFYYDFDVGRPFTPEDIPKIEEKIAELLKSDEKFERKEVGRKDALKIFKDEPYKSELIKELHEGEPLSVYALGDFTDLCRGPHIPSLDKIGGIKLTKISSAYWRGDAKNASLQRIYGISFPEKKELSKWIKVKEESVKRNHLKIGTELDLYSFHDESPGVPFFHPKGMVIWNELLKFWREEHFKRGYGEVNTPIILKRELWERSGHWDHYKENMYFTQIDEEDYAIKPMNCPGGILIYKTKRHSYRDLPLRVAELGTVHRHELSGVLNGLFRVRKFTQDDAHIYCTPEQIKGEVIGVIELFDFIYGSFGFNDYRIELSTKPEKAMGSKEMWDAAESGLKEALEAKGIDYKLNEGDGAFYGPKIDFHINDALGRSWQCGTIQLDFTMPDKFGLYYIGKDDKEHRPIMLHRTCYGSIERFLGILVEHYAGAFPLWLSPVQVKVIPVSEKFSDYAKSVDKELKAEGIRSELDLRTETVSYKIRDAQMKKINYMVVVGEREMKGKTVTPRTRDEKVLKALKLGEFVEKLKKEIGNKD